MMLGSLDQVFWLYLVTSMLGQKYGWSHGTTTNEGIKIECL